MKLERPAIHLELHPHDFRRWHWWKDELVDFCREQGLPVSGRKDELIDRIARHLGTYQAANGGVAAVGGLDAGDRSSRPAPTGGRSQRSDRPDPIYLDFAQAYFAHHPEATLRESWKAFKWARRQGRLPVSA